jgi:hypothetical protein
MFTKQEKEEFGEQCSLYYLRKEGSFCNTDADLKGPSVESITWSEIIDNPQTILIMNPDLEACPKTTLDSVPQYPYRRSLHDVATPWYGKHV